MTKIVVTMPPNLGEGIAWAIQTDIRKRLTTSRWEADPDEPPTYAHSFPAVLHIPLRLKEPNT